MSARRSALARVQVVLEIEAGSWGPDCTMGQVTSQAREEAADRVKRLLRAATTPDADLGIKRETLDGVRLVSVGRVDVVLREDAER